MTSKKCQSGSERIASVVDILVDEAWGGIDKKITNEELNHKFKNTYITLYAIWMPKFI